VNHLATPHAGAATGDLVDDLTNDYTVTGDLTPSLTGW
jgi:hypothetical protein